jgi:hypothetical protein
MVALTRIKARIPQSAQQRGQKTETEQVPLGRVEATSTAEPQNKLFHRKSQ